MSFRVNNLSITIRIFTGKEVFPISILVKPYDECMSKPRDTLRCSFAATCIDHQPIRTLTTGKREDQRLVKCDWYKFVPTIVIPPILYINIWRENKLEGTCLSANVGLSLSYAGVVWTGVSMGRISNQIPYCDFKDQYYKPVWFKNVALLFKNLGK